MKKFRKYKIGLFSFVLLYGCMVIPVSVLDKSGVPNKGDGKTVESLIKRANMAGRLINDKDIPYPFAGVSGKHDHNDIIPLKSHGDNRT